MSRSSKTKIKRSKSKGPWLIRGSKRPTWLTRVSKSLGYFQYFLYLVPETTMCRKKYFSHKHDQGFAQNISQDPKMF